MGYGKDMPEKYSAAGWCHKGCSETVALRFLRFVTSYFLINYI